jgi:hypothetical protein
MKFTLVLPVVFLVTSNIGMAGGLSIDNVNEHMNADSWVETNSTPVEIVVKGPLDKFDVVIPQQEEEIIDRNKFRQSNDKLSFFIIDENEAIAGDPNFIQKLIRRIA